MQSAKAYNEREVVKGCADNQRKAQEMLYKQHFDTMMRMCVSKTKNPNIAMEVVNTGFLKVFQNIHKFTFSGSLEGWIRRIVYNSMCDYFRSNKKYNEAFVFEERDRPSQETALDSLYADDLMELIESLPKKSQKIFQMFAIEGYSHADISKELEISEGTSKWHMSNARALLKSKIKEGNLFNYGE